MLLPFVLIIPIVLGFLITVVLRQENKKVVTVFGFMKTGMFNQLIQLCQFLYREADALNKN